LSPSRAIFRRSRIAQGAHRCWNFPRRHAPAQPGHFRREHARDRLGFGSESGSGARIAGGVVR
jgi:hypothetical protein